MVDAGLIIFYVFLVGGAFTVVERTGALGRLVNSMVRALSSLGADEVERYLAEHRPDWKAPQRALVARLSEGAVGRARSFDLSAYVAARAHGPAAAMGAIRGLQACHSPPPPPTNSTSPLPLGPTPRRDLPAFFIPPFPPKPPYWSTTDDHRHAVRRI